MWQASLFSLLVIVASCHACWRKDSSLTKLKNVVSRDKVDEERCYAGWGCFPEFQKSKELTKPLSDLLMFADPPEEIDVHFFMFDCHEHRLKGYPLRYNASLTNIPYDGNKQTIVIIHGFTDKYDEMQWMGYLKDFIFKQSCNFNVIGVDWRNASQTCNYFNSVADTQIVGAVVAGFLRNLMRAHNQSAQQVTIVGHSLGAHVSGFIGANFTNPKLRSILGLDPAGPAFRDIATRFRLDPSDADLVVTLTTNAGLTSLNGNGLNKGVGHYSFFVNGGYHQPGCTGRPGDAVSILETLFSSSASCSHQRPTWLIQVAGDEAGECQSMGYRCQSYEAFVGGECGTCDEGSDQCMPLHSFFNFWNQEFDRLKQMRSNNGSLVYYVDTSEEMPYCVCHYQLILTTAQGDSFKGNFKMALEGELRDLDGFQFKKDNFNIKPNTTFKALVKVAKNIGKLKSIQIEAIQEKGLILPSSTKRITIKSIELNYMSALTLSERKRYSTKAEFGPQQNTTLGTDGPATRLFIN